MAKEISKPPKERINITYKTETGGAVEQKELPLKLLMLGDYTLKEDPTRLEDRKPVKIDKDNFDKVMREQDLELTINVPDRLSEQDEDKDNQKDNQAEIPVHLKFDSLKDFGPEKIARQVPELKKLLEIREALVALKGPLGNIRAFREKIEEHLSDEASRKLLAELIK